MLPEQEEDPGQLSDPDHTDYYKANRDILQNVGILASHTGGNTYIQNVFNSSALPDSDELSRLSKEVKQLQDSDIIEGEIVNETD